MTRVRTPRGRGAEDDRVFTIDGELVELDEFIDANRDGLHDEEIEALRAMRPGDSFVLGGGAWAEFVIACEAAPEVSDRC